MLKYVDTKVVFAEVPDEITLAINISNCPCQCKGCHSPYLTEDVGKPLTPTALRILLKSNKGISCVAFMGGDSNPEYINRLAKWVRINEFRDLRIAWYSGRQELSADINLENFDYVKLGPYIEELGPLTSETTNQRFYEVQPSGDYVEDIHSVYRLCDITDKFWKK